MTETHAEQQGTDTSGANSTQETPLSSDEIKREMARVDSELRELEESSEAWRRKLGDKAHSMADEVRLYGDGAEEAAKASAARRNLIRQYEHLSDDETRNDEYRATRAWELYDEAKPKIEQAGRAAREALLKRAKHLERMSMPFPTGQTPRTDNIEHLNLTQGEHRRIVERLSYENPEIARMRAEGKKTPDGPKPHEILSEEYARGLEIGGVQGAAICRAVVQVALDRDYDPEAIVTEYRTEVHEGYLQSAQEARMRASSIYTRVPQPPYRRPGGGIKGIEEAGGPRRNALGLPRKGYGTRPNQKRRPSWK
jgi:hypothetical protein